MQIAHKRATSSGVRERWVADEVVNKQQVWQIVVVGWRSLPWRRRVHDAIAVDMRGAITTGRLPSGTVKRHPYSTLSMVSISAEVDLIVLGIEPKPHLF